MIEVERIEIEKEKETQIERQTREGKRQVIAN
jgi:hypothetical protein